MRAKTDDAKLFEIVSFFIYDLGRAVELAQARKAVIAAGFPADSDPDNGPWSTRRRDTPASLSLPTPLRFPAGSSGSKERADAETEIKIYDDGAMTIVVRERGRFSLEELPAASVRPLLRISGETLGAEAWAELLFGRILAVIETSILGPVPHERRDRESYTAFCLLEAPKNPARYAADHRKEIAALMIGESSEPPIHEGQIEAALSRPFSYRNDDFAVFDMDRCFIIEPRGDYEDILLIVEHANYRLLELRALDKLLDKRLDEAEKEVFARMGRGKRLKVGSPQRKFARIQALRFEALFILENLENSSKIIGDFYLCQIYDRLCEIFNTEGWKRSVERRLDILSSVYDMAKTDSAQRRSLMLEIIFIAVCVILPVLQIWQALILN